MTLSQDKDDGTVKAEGPKIRLLRKNRAWSMDMLCNKSGITSKILRNIETKPGYSCRPSTIEMLAKTLDVEPSILVRHDVSPPTILRSSEAVQHAMLQIVSEAQTNLAVCGSRSSESGYLKAIEDALKTKPRLVHYRVLFGPPLRKELRDHLVALRQLRDPDDRSQGHQTLFLAVYEDRRRQAEFSVCVGDKQAFLVLPSFTQFGNYDTALLLHDADSVDGLLRFVKSLYLAARKIEDLDSVQSISHLPEATYNG